MDNVQHGNDVFAFEDSISLRGNELIQPPSLDPGSDEESSPPPFQKVADYL